MVVMEFEDIFFSVGVINITYIYAETYTETS